MSTWDKSVTFVVDVNQPVEPLLIECQNSVWHRGGLHALVQGSKLNLSVRFVSQDGAGVATEELPAGDSVSVVGKKIGMGGSTVGDALFSALDLTRTIADQTWGGVLSLDTAELDTAMGEGAKLYVRTEVRVVNSAEELVHLFTIDSQIHRKVHGETPEEIVNNPTYYTDEEVDALITAHDDSSMAHGGVEAAFGGHVAAHPRPTVRDDRNEAAGTAQTLITSHDHSGTTDGPQLAQANTHESPDTDVAPTSLHHTLGTGANQAAAGNDSRLSDDRDPSAHAASHTDGTDDIQDATNALKGLATAAQITALEAALPYATGATIIAQPGDNLATRYAEAIALTPGGNALSATNRAALIILPGTYALAAEWTVATEFVDVLGLGYTLLERGAVPGVLLTGFTINVTADNVRVQGISVGTQNFTTASDKPLQQIFACVGGDSSFGGGGTTSGTFINCTGGNTSFGGLGTASGTFTNCTGGDNAFGGDGGTAQGTFTACTGGTDSFGGGYGTASGTFTACTGGTFSFGGGFGSIAATARFYRCDFGGFVGQNSTVNAAAEFHDCTGLSSEVTGSSAKIYSSTDTAGKFWHTGTISGTEVETAAGAKLSEAIPYTGETRAVDLTGAASVSVPDGSTDAHAASFGQAKTLSGFPNRTDSNIDVFDDDGTMTFRIQPAASSFVVWTGGVQHVISNARTVTIANDKALHYVFFDTDGVLKVQAGDWDIRGDKAPTALVYRDNDGGATFAEQYALTDERHSADRDLAWHEWAHLTIGARYGSGFPATFNNTTLSVEQGVIFDEDIQADTGVTPQTTATLWYQNPSPTPTTMTFRRGSTTPYAVTTGALAYDDDGALTAIATTGGGRYVTNDVYATNDPDEPIYIVIGQQESANLAEAQSAPLATVLLTTAEWKLIYRVIYRNIGGTTTHMETIDQRQVSTGPAGTASPASHSALIDRDAANSHPATAISYEDTTVAGALAAKSDLPETQTLAVDGAKTITVTRPQTVANMSMEATATVTIADPPATTRPWWLELFPTQDATGDRVLTIAGNTLGAGTFVLSTAATAKDYASLTWQGTAWVLTNARYALS